MYKLFGSSFSHSLLYEEYKSKPESLVDKRPTFNPSETKKNIPEIGQIILYKNTKPEMKLRNLAQEFG